jgi:hypothetical protein
MPDHQKAKGKEGQWQSTGVTCGGFGLMRSKGDFSFTLDGISACSSDAREWEMP